MKLISSVAGEVHLLLKFWVKFANLESDVLRPITFPSRREKTFKEFEFWCYKYGHSEILKFC